MNSARRHGVHLYRAVRPAELADIYRYGCLRTPPGITVKYFTLSWLEAIRYADLAQTAFKDGPYTVVCVRVGVDYPTEAEGVVDRGIRAVLLSTAQLDGLVPEIPSH